MIRNSKDLLKKLIIGDIVIQIQLPELVAHRKMDSIPEKIKLSL